jgi:metallo-beta-lactamase family protein
MQLTSYGAAQTVTGSKHLLTLDNGEHILLDCGLYQEDQEDERAGNEKFGFRPDAIDHVVLSHAHIDHSGLLAKLVKEGFNGNIFCTPATYALCKILLEDSGKIQEFETEDRNKEREKHDKSPLSPLYTRQDAFKCLEYFYPVPFNQSFKITPSVEGRFIDNGHLLGSGSVNLTIRENGQTHQLCFTGDVGRNSNLLLPAPQSLPQSDTIICESTYGDRLHSKKLDPYGRIFEVVEDTCLRKKGKLLIPAFSVGRTQELLYVLQQLYQQGELPELPIYLDSPLAIKATAIYARFMERFNAGVKEFMHKYNDPFRFKPVKMLKKPDASKKLNKKRDPAIIIAGAGMMHAGRIVHHIIHHISNPANTLLVVGYCAEGTLGRTMLQRPKEIQVFDKKFPVRAQVREMDDFSSHADYEEIQDYLSCQNPKRVQNLFLVHGNENVFPFFKKQLEDFGFPNVTVPREGQTYQL